MFKGFCVECYVEDHELVKIPRLIKLELCTSCLRARLHGEWLPSTEPNIAHFLEELVKVKGIKDYNVKAELVRTLKDGALFRIVVKGKLGEQELKLEKSVRVKYLKKQCLVCARKKSSYYKALMQIRPKSRETPYERLKLAFRLVRNKNREFVREDREAEIFRFTKTKYGIDVFFGSLKSAQACIHLLTSRLNAKVIESRSLVGIDKDGKKNYKTTYSVRV